MLDWSSGYFYSGQVRAHPDNSSITLSQLIRTNDNIMFTAPLLWLDTVDEDWGEDVEDEESISNIGEAVVVADIVNRVVTAGLKQEQVGVITPYWAQVSLIRSLLWETDGLGRVEVRTVDGFQGREKEMIILSMVRSNDKREVGFLSESRRINVSVSRARRCCVIIGDSGTLTHDHCCLSLYNYCRDNQVVHSVRNI